MNQIWCLECFVGTSEWKFVQRVPTQLFNLLQVLLSINWIPLEVMKYYSEEVGRYIDQIMLRTNILKALNTTVHKTNQYLGFNKYIRM